MNNYFIWTKHNETQPRIESIIDERAKENMNILDDVYSHHDDGCEDDIGQDDADLSDEGFDVEELKRNAVSDVLLQRKKRVSIILRYVIKHRENFFTRNANGVIRSTRCCG
jgi:hypothetical protein